MFVLYIISAAFLLGGGLILGSHLAITTNRGRSRSFYS